MSKEIQKKKSDTLMGLVSEYRALEQDLESDNSEAVARLQGKLKAKLDGVVDWLDFRKGYLHGLNVKKDELMKMIKSTKAERDRFVDYVLSCMDALEAVELKGECYKVSIRKPVEVVEILDEGKIPLEYTEKKVSYSIDKKRLLADLKAGKKIPGAKITLGNRNLTIGRQ